MFSGAYHGSKILLTGDTGFKGAWLAYWLNQLGAKVTGLALPPASVDVLFEQARLSDLVDHIDGDIRDLATVQRVFREVQPDLVFHMAAQAIVRESYSDPVGTMMTNGMGTVHVCEGLRALGKPCATVIVTSDKCYANNEWPYGYRENDPMGGSDPYSASKGVSELIAASWRKSFFPVERLEIHRKPLATVRAGNVIGPGDWAADRVVPDAIRALRDGQPVVLRNPNAVRPWQHVLEPLSGYLALGAKLLSPLAAEFAQAWNFGPLPASTCSVRELVEGIIREWGGGSWRKADEKAPPPEATLLRLSIDKATAGLAWSPVWDFSSTCRRTAHGYTRLLTTGRDPEATRAMLTEEIDQYVRDASKTRAAWPGSTAA